MQLDEQVTEGTKHRQGRHAWCLWGDDGFIQKKSGKKIKLEKILMVMFF